MFEYLKDLNEAQTKAVKHIDGPSLIIAGAGSGKTRVLTYKILYLLDSGYNPENILALTFTNKAAGEMKERMWKLMPPKRFKGLWIGTFHSIFARILRNEAEYLGFSKNFTIYDTEDSKNELTRIIKELNLDTNHYKPQKIQGIISNAKNNLYTYQTYAQDTDIQKVLHIKKLTEVPLIFEKYQIRLKKNNVMDFDDLLLYTNILFRDYPEILDKYRDLFRFVLVDEYQDTNFAQYLIIKKLALKHRKISVVGDDSQSIYAFRGARIENIFAFQKDFPEYKLFKLELNYRSTKNIVNAANSVIENNINKIPKTLYTQNEEGEKVKVLEFDDDRKEADFVAQQIKQMIDYKGFRYKDFAVLYRMNSQSRIFEQYMKRYGIPYKIFGGFSFYKRQEIKNLLAYLKLITNKTDTESLLRIINIPKRGIGKATLTKLLSLAEKHNLHIWYLMQEKDLLLKLFHKTTVTKLLNFVNLIKELSELKLQLNAVDFIKKVLEKSGLKQMYLPKFEDNESVDRYENIMEFVNDAAQYTEENPDATIEDFLAQVSLLTSEDKVSDKEKNYVSLMTVHSAKGLEFPVVFIVGVVDGVFPVGMSTTSTKGLEEERRLFYVAITRSKKILYITYSTMRMIWGRYEYTENSRFIDEIDEKFIEHKNSKKFYKKNFAYKPENNYISNLEPKPEKRNLIKISEKPKQETENIRYSDDLYGLKKGMKVSHKKFGIGEVLFLEGTGANTKVTVDFVKVGKKKLLLKFAKLQVLK